MRITILVVLLVLICGCAEQFYTPLEPSTGHITAAESVPQENIPDLVRQAPVLPEPEPPVEQEKYTVVVNEVPVKELLFALARDAKINVDIHPRIAGLVTINAVDQTLTQLLQRISRQVDLRYEFDQDNLIISPDEPFIRTYKVGYLNLSRETSGSVTVSTQIASASSGGGEGGGGGGGNTSTTQIESESNHQFWQNLSTGIASILNESGVASDAAANGVVINPESG